MQESQEPRVQSLDWEDPLEEETATNSSILTTITLLTEKPGGLQHWWGCKESDMIEVTEHALMWIVLLYK